MTQREYIEQCEFALEINKELMQQGIVASIVVGATKAPDESFIDGYFYLRSYEKDDFSISYSNGRASIIESAKNLVNEVKYTQILNLCIDLIGKWVYKDKDMAFFVEAITKDGLVCSRYGKQYTLTANNLYIQGVQNVN